MKCCRPPSFSSTIMGRSWADHGQIMGRPWAIDSCRKILKISAFSDTVFSRKIMKICDFPTRLEQSVKLFLQTPLVQLFSKWKPFLNHFKIDFWIGLKWFWHRFQIVFYGFELVVTGWDTHGVWSTQGVTHTSHTPCMSHPVSHRVCDRPRVEFRIQLGLGVRVLFRALGLGKTGYASGVSSLE